MVIFAIILAYFHVLVPTYGRNVDPQKSIVWGPGLNPVITTPVRYFFIQAIDNDGNKYNESCGARAFSVKISHSRGEHVRASVEVLDRNDGLYIVRYLLYETKRDLKISVLYKGSISVANSPYVMKGLIYHEFCRCPEPSTIQWMADMQCPPAWTQIQSDLSQFTAINMSKLAPVIKKRFSERHSYSLVHYKIINNQIYIKTQGEHVGFRMFSDALLLSLTRKVRLPDMEFFVNLGDWPLVKKTHKSDLPVPMFSWCGSDDSLDIVMPTYDLMEATFSMMSRVSLDILSVQSTNSPKWDDKIERGFWRGRDSRQERLDLAVLSRQNPNEIDAALTHMFFFPKNDKKYGKLVKSISFFDFFKYKYQITVDGTVAAYRLPYLMAGDSVVLKQDSYYYEHFYNDLKPWIHYIPFKRNLSDLLEKLRWAKEHDAEARIIAQNARKFVNENLLPQHLLCYYITLFMEYSKLLVSPVIHDKSFELVTDDPSDTYNNYQCPCDHVSSPQEQKHDEL